MSGTGLRFTNHSEQENIPITFSTLCMGSKKQRARVGVTLKKQKLFSIFTLQTVRGNTPLAKPAANRKRGRQENTVICSI